MELMGRGPNETAIVRLSRKEWEHLGNLLEPGEASGDAAPILEAAQRLADARSDFYMIRERLSQAEKAIYGRELP